MQEPSYYLLSSVKQCTIPEHRQERRPGKWWLNREGREEKRREEKRREKEEWRGEKEREGRKVKY